MPFDLAQAVQQLKQEEGFRASAYRDTGAHVVIGYGHLLLAGEKRVITLERAQQVLLEDIHKAYVACAKLWPDFATYPQTAQVALVDVAFLVGERKLSHFRELRAAVTRQDWQKAAQALHTSKLHRQVRRRAQRLEQRLQALAAQP
jgi:GH24 family phage-related lysozyme (muramidase)